MHVLLTWSCRCSSFRQVFLSLIRDHCEYDGTVPKDDASYGTRSIESSGSYFGGLGLSLRSMKSISRRGKLVSASNRQLGSGFSARQTGSQTVVTAGSDGTYGTVATPVVGNSAHAQSVSTPLTPGTPDSFDSFASIGTSSLVSTPGIRRNMLMRSKAVRGDDEFNDAASVTTDGDTVTNQSIRSLAGRNRYLPGGLGRSHHATPSASGHSHGTPTPYTHSRTPRPEKPESLSSSLHQLKALGDSDRRSTLSKAMSTRSALRSSMKTNSTRVLRSAVAKGLSSRSAFGDRSVRDDSSVMSMDKTSTHEQQLASVPYFEKLCWICEQLDYPFEYADIVGSQFLGLESANPVTHIDGHVPTMDELVEYLALAFICITEFADLSVVVLDDFQWVDAFSWKIFRVLCTRGKKLMLICATRSHDKQAMRRMSSAVTNENKLQLTEVPLGPLNFSEIGELVALVLEVDRSAVTDNLCTDIFQRTGGLPVFVVQVLENIRRKKTLELIEGTLKWTAEGLKEQVSCS